MHGTPFTEGETADLAFPRVSADRLTVKVNDELILDAGTIEPGISGSEVLIRPPVVPMYRQLLEYLKQKPEPARSRLTVVNEEALAAAALTIRWGTYLAVLLDLSKPVAPDANDPAVSQIADSEMARINLEASSALAEWIEAYEQDEHGTLSLARRAAAYLPLPRTVDRAPDFLGSFALIDTYRELKTQMSLDRWKQAQELAALAPSRVIANAMINYAYRNNTSIENAHAGTFKGYSLTHSRLTRIAVQTFERSLSANMKLVVRSCFALRCESRGRTKIEQAIPYALWASYPHEWSLSETTRDITLPCR